MQLSRPLLARRLYAELDYTRHFPKSYMDHVRRRVPVKVYDNRFGAPPVTRWAIPPDDYYAASKRPWEQEEIRKIMQRETDYKRNLFSAKFFRKNWNNKLPPIPSEHWTIFPGDLVQVMVGKHKGRKNIVSHVIKETNAIFVEGLHTKLVTKVDAKSMKKLGVELGMDQAWEEQPLYVHKGEVQLVDPNDQEPCTATWVLNDSKTEYERISTRTGFRIPLPKRALSTYEYVTPQDYLEAKEKDTPAEIVLKKTFMPKLCTFEQDIEEEMGLEKQSEVPRPPTYWY